ncbi:DUF1841 family protein [Candidatus Dependentiae bacterium]|nr:DUF1841 family protein [Candidatus Dependentiae bacterium]
MKGKHFQVLNSDEEFIYDIMNDHPEYYVHYECANNEDFDYENSESTNPFLHLSLHIILKKVLQSCKVNELNLFYNELLKKAENHYAEHILINEFLNELPVMIQQIESSEKLKKTEVILPDYILKKIKNTAKKYL